MIIENDQKTQVLIQLHSTRHCRAQVAGYLWLRFEESSRKKVGNWRRGLGGFVWCFLLLSLDMNGI